MFLADIDLVNYADDTTPYAYNLNLNSVIHQLEESAGKLFKWFTENYLQANPDKCSNEIRKKKGL